MRHPFSRTAPYQVPLPFFQVLTHACTSLRSKTLAVQHRNYKVLTLGGESNKSRTRRILPCGRTKLQVDQAPLEALDYGLRAITHVQTQQDDTDMGLHSRLFNR
jgi:hypothetical protein